MSKRHQCGALTLLILSRASNVLGQGPGVIKGRHQPQRYLPRKRDSDKRKQVIF